MPNSKKRTGRGGWNKGKVIGAKKPLDEGQLGMLRRILADKRRTRDLALLETAVSTMLRGSDLLRLTVADVRDNQGEIVESLTVRMSKTKKPVTVMISDTARDALAAWIAEVDKRGSDYLFTARRDPHGSAMTTVSYRRLIKEWAGLIHADPDQFSTHSLRRTNATALYRKTGNLRAVQLLLGHNSIAMTQRYLGIEIDDALTLARRHQI